MILLALLTPATANNTVYICAVSSVVLQLHSSADSASRPDRAKSLTTFHIIHDDIFVGGVGLTDTPTSMLPAKAGSARCVQRFDDSQVSAIRKTYRISLRSSSLWEPRHPSLKVVLWHLPCLSDRSQRPRAHTSAACCCSYTRVRV